MGVEVEIAFSAGYLLRGRSAAIVLHVNGPRVHEEVMDGQGLARAEVDIACGADNWSRLRSGDRVSGGRVLVQVILGVELAATNIAADWDGRSRGKLLFEPNLVVKEEVLIQG